MDLNHLKLPEAKLVAEHLKPEQLMPRRNQQLLPPKTLLFWVTKNLRESRECALKPATCKTTTPWEKPKDRSYKVFQTLEFQNGQIPFTLKEKEKRMRESKNSKTMKSKEEKSMLRRRVINKNSDKVSLTRLTNNSTTTKIWLRLFTARCFLCDVTAEQ